MRSKEAGNESELRGLAQKASWRDVAGEGPGAPDAKTWGLGQTEWAFRGPQQAGEGNQRGVLLKSWPFPTAPV